MEIITISDSTNHFEFNDYLIKKALYALRSEIDETQQNDMPKENIQLHNNIIHVRNCFIELLKLLIINKEYKKFLEILNNFCDGHYLDGYLAVFNCTDNIFLPKITELFQMFICDLIKKPELQETVFNINNDRLYFNLTKTLLVYFKYEVVNDPTFTETNNFIDLWLKYYINIDNNNIENLQIRKSFQLFLTLIKLFQLDNDIEIIMDNILNESR